MLNRILMRRAVAMVVLVVVWLSVGIAAAQTRKGTIHAKPENVCQIDPNGNCWCGTPWWTPRTGDQRPCRDEFRRRPPQKSTPSPAEALLCSSEMFGGSPGGGWANNQFQSDLPSNQVRNRGSLIRPQQTQPTLNPACNWGEWMTNPVRKNPPGLRYVIWKAQNDEIKKPVYDSPNRFVTPGPNLAPGQKWKIWWATSNVSVTFTLRCLAKAGDNPLKSTCTVLNEPTFNSQDDPNWSYWLFLKTQVLPKVLPYDTKIPPWPPDPGQGPFPAGSQGPNFYEDNSGITRYYIDLPYTFGLQIGQQTPGRDPW